MSTLVTVKAAFRSTAYRAALNTAFTGASLAGLGTTYGIQPDVSLLAGAPALPAMAVEVLAAEPGGHLASGGYTEVRARVVLKLAIADSTEATVRSDAEKYVDHLRAVTEAQLRTSFNRLHWVASDLEGGRYSNEAGTPLRLVTVTFEAFAWQTEGTA